MSSHLVKSRTSAGPVEHGVLPVDIAVAVLRIEDGARRSQRPAPDRRKRYKRPSPPCCSPTVECIMQAIGLPATFA